MSQSVPNSGMPTSTHDGYLSEESKRKFTITAGILGAVFFFVQFLAPILAMMLMMPVFLLTSFKITEYDLDRAAVHEDRLYFYAEETSPNTVAGSLKLMGLELKDVPTTELVKNEGSFAGLFGPSDEEESGPIEIAEIKGESPWLLAGDERLLLISQSKMWELMGNELVETASYASLGNISRPFFYEGSPAVIEGSPDGIFLAVYDSGQWERSPVFLEKRKDLRDTEGCVQVVSIDGTNHIFLKIGLVVFHRVGLPLDSSGSDDEEWQSIGSAQHPWQSFELDGKPALLASGHNGIKSYLFDDGKWSKTFHSSTANPFNRYVYPLSIGGSLRIATSGFSDSLRLYSLKENNMVLNARFGGDFPFPRSIMPMMFIPHIANLFVPILLAVILSGLMLKHRVSIHSHGGETVQYASLTRRALAQVVDGMVLFAGVIPLAMQWFNMFDMFDSESDTMMFPIKMLGAFLFTFAWAIFLLLVFSLTEGKWGITPGKWLVGIRVIGTDLRPCGFGRALLRNFLKVVDGFFNFLVGIFIVTFTKDWQRVGDMAARTIVIRPVRE